MKKLIVLIALVFTTLSYSQAEYEKIAITANGVSSSTTKINTQETNGEINYINATSLPVSTATTNALELETDVSAGAITGFALTNNGNGTVNIASGTAFLRTTNDPYAQIIKYPISAVTNLALTDNANNYVLVDYNSGAPALTVTTNSSTINTQTNSLAYVISRVGTTLDYLSLVGQNVDHNAKLRVRFLNQEGIRRASGAVLGFSSRNLTLTSSVLFSGLIRINAVAFNTASPDTFTIAYNNGSAWTRTTGQTQVNNTQYNVSGTLTTMPNNDYRTDYVYLLPNNPSKLYVIMGTATYNSLTLAKAAPRPSALPVELQVLGLEVGRLFIQKNSATIAEVQSSFANDFIGASVPEHNALTGLQGGTAGEYNHLTNAQVSLVNGSEQTANKQNSLATDGTGVKFPTVDAINSVIVNETTGVFSNIQTLIDNNPSGTTINLKPNTVYVQQNGLVVKDRITINGNGATLKRDTQQTTTTTVSANQASTSITVASIPAGLVIGDRIQLYTDNTVNTSSQSVKITNIVGSVITLENALTHSNSPTYTWAIGTTVRKVYHQINTPLDGSGIPIATVYTVKNLIIDGNYTNNTGNYYWGVNSAVFNNGKSLYEKCKFINMPNENIIGHGFSIKNSYAENLNGSFIHQSANITLGEDIFGGEISGNTTKNTNIQATPSVTGHSEGVICFSFSSGRISIHGNRFLGGGEAVLGVIASSVNSIDGANKNLIFNDNYAENFTKVVSSFNYFSSGFVTNVDNVSISNNIFSNCGSNDWSSYASNIANMGVIKFTGNILTNGTTVTNIPEKMKAGFLLSGGTLNKIPKYNSLGYLVDGSLIDNGTILETTKSIFKVFPTQGTAGTPVYDKILYGGIDGTNESSILFGNSFGNNNGTYIKLSTNPTGSGSSPNNAVIINPSGVVDFEQIPTAPTATAGTNTTQIATTAFVQTAVSSGTYTPSLTNTTNVAASGVTDAVYTKIGNVVTVRIGYTVSVTSASATAVLTITLPINRTVTSTLNVGSGGMGYGSSSNTYVPSIVQTASNSTEALIIFTAPTTNTYASAVTFSYSL
jgi:hypothetical protein